MLSICWTPVTCTTWNRWFWQHVNSRSLWLWGQRRARGQELATRISRRNTNVDQSRGPEWRRQGAEMNVDLVTEWERRYILDQWGVQRRKLWGYLMSLSEYELTDALSSECKAKTMPLFICFFSLKPTGPFKNYSVILWKSTKWINRKCLSSSFSSISTTTNIDGSGSSPGNSVISVLNCVWGSVSRSTWGAEQGNEVSMTHCMERDTILSCQVDRSIGEVYDFPSFPIFGGPFLCLSGLRLELPSSQAVLEPLSMDIRIELGQEHC